MASVVHRCGAERHVTHMPAAKNPTRRPKKPIQQSRRPIRRPKRLIQQLFELRESPIQGLGAFATQRIPRGTRIIEYVGERIAPAEADARYDDEKMERHHTFLFTVSSRTVVDATHGGNDSRFINHSCTPNCRAVIRRGRIFIEAKRDIPAGAELTYDYAYERGEEGDEKSEGMYPCACGSPRCRGTILAPRKKRGG